NDITRLYSGVLRKKFVTGLPNVRSLAPILPTPCGYLLFRFVQFLNRTGATWAGCVVLPPRGRCGWGRGLPATGCCGTGVPATGVGARATLTSSVVPARRSRTKTSKVPFASSGTRFVAREKNATKRPSALSGPDPV